MRVNGGIRVTVHGGHNLTTHGAGSDCAVQKGCPGDDRGEREKEREGERGRESERVRESVWSNLKKRVLQWATSTLQWSWFIIGTHFQSKYATLRPVVVAWVSHTLNGSHLPPPPPPPGKTMAGALGWQSETCTHFGSQCGDYKKWSGQSLVHIQLFLTLCIVAAN